MRNPSEASWSELLKELKELTDDSGHDTHADVAERLAHELQVYQIELEMQNRELRESQRQLEEARDRYADLYDFAPVGYLTLDGEGVIREVNLTGAALLGKERSLLLDKPLSMWVAKKHKPAFFNHLKRTFVARKLVVDELEIETDKHSSRWVSLQSESVPDEKSTLCRTALIDISERRQAEDHMKLLEAQLRQAQKMETIGTLASGIAHDFNNILQPVSSCAEMLRSRLPSDSPLLKYVDMMSKSVERGSGLVKQLLSFSRQREDGRKLLRLHPVLIETLDMIRAVFPTTVEIQEEIDPACGPVLADPVQIQQIVMNLCTNARDAMNGNGVLTIQLTAVAIDDILAKSTLRLLPGRYARLTVQDAGHGMNDETQKRIFDPFFTTKEVGKGTGLGLSVIYGIVLEYGGEIMMESSPGKGSTFCVYLPCSNDEPAE